MQDEMMGCPLSSFTLHPSSLLPPTDFGLIGQNEERTTLPWSPPIEPHSLARINDCCCPGFPRLCKRRKGNPSRQRQRAPGSRPSCEPASGIPNSFLNGTSGDKKGGGTADRCRGCRPAGVREPIASPEAVR